MPWWKKLFCFSGLDGMAADDACPVGSFRRSKTCGSVHKPSQVRSNSLHRCDTQPSTLDTTIYSHSLTQQLLNEAPTMITALGLEEGLPVVFQNALSREYYSCLISADLHSGTLHAKPYGISVLERLFSLEGNAVLAHMLQTAVAQCNTWKRTVRVNSPAPASLDSVAADVLDTKLAAAVEQPHSSSQHNSQRDSDTLATPTGRSITSGGADVRAALVVPAHRSSAEDSPLELDADIALGFGCRSSPLYKFADHPTPPRRMLSMLSYANHTNERRRSSAHRRDSYASRGSLGSSARDTDSCLLPMPLEPLGGRSWRSSMEGCGAAAHHSGPAAAAGQQLSSIDLAQLGIQIGSGGAQQQLQDRSSLEGAASSSHSHIRTTSSHVLNADTGPREILRLKRWHTIDTRSAGGVAAEAEAAVLGADTAGVVSHDCHNPGEASAPLNLPSEAAAASNASNALSVESLLFAAGAERGRIIATRPSKRSFGDSAASHSCSHCCSPMAPLTSPSTSARLPVASAFGAALAAGTAPGSCPAAGPVPLHALAGCAGIGSGGVRSSNSVDASTMELLMGVAEEGPDSDERSVAGRGSEGVVHQFWEVTAKVVVQQGTGRRLLLLQQVDVTGRVNVEGAMSELTEAQLAMLSQIFPRHVIEFLCVSSLDKVPTNMGKLARRHDNVTVLFMDIVGFTAMSKEVAPDVVMAFLNELFTTFDALCDMYRVQKVETAGDCYIVAGGILSPDDEGFNQVDAQHDPVDSARRVLAFARHMMSAATKVTMPHNGQPVTIRIGMHTGPCVSGLVGTKLPKFSIFGDTMNTASRMESTAPHGCIQVSAATYELLQRASAAAAANASCCIDVTAADLPSSAAAAAAQASTAATPTASESGPEQQAGRLNLADSECSTEEGPADENGKLPLELRMELWKSTGGVEVKGKGVMETFVWVPIPQ